MRLRKKWLKAALFSSTIHERETCLVYVWIMKSKEEIWKMLLIEWKKK